VHRAFLAFLIILPLLSGTLFATTGKWKSFTSKKEVRDVVVAGSRIWAATSGGMFSYDFTDSTYEQFTTSEGLHTIDLTAITADDSGIIWIGGSNGLLQSYYPKFQSWEYITGILSVPDQPQKTINALQGKGDTLLILSDIGVSIFSRSRLEFGDTYKRFGSGSSQLVGNAVGFASYQGQFWVATGNGIATTPISTPNPSEPGSWQVLNTGLPSTAVHALAVFQDVLYAATASGLAMLNGTTWQVVPQSAGMNITDLSTDLNDGVPSVPSSLYFSMGNELFRYDGTSVTTVTTGFPSSITSLGTQMALGTAGNGAMSGTSSSADQWTQFIPPGPHTNSLVGMVADANGVLWAGTGTAAGKGFLSFDGSTWTPYLPDADTQFLHTRYSYIINLGDDNSKWISTFGNGVARMNKDNIIDYYFNTTNGLSYTANTGNNTSFVVTTGVVTERNGDVWINVRSAADRKLLAIYSPSADTFRYISYPVGSQIPILVNMIMDSYGTKWFTPIYETGNTAPGLVFYDKTLRLSRRIESTSGWGIITSSQDGLTDNNVSAVAVDLDGSLWVGTNQGGINIIVEPTIPYQILQYHPLQGQKINDILVDPINQKWVATEQGVFLLSPDGTSILAEYTVESTDGKLPDNHVKSIAMNRDNGTIYFGTEAGLATLTTAAVTPRTSFDGLKIYPNPYLLPSSDVVTIDGLVENSSVKVLSVSGSLIKDISTPGGRIGFWDGTDDRGNLVPSGIYIITAYSKDGTRAGNGKVAVIRK